MKACDAIRDKILRAVVTANDGPLAGQSIGELTLSDRKIVATSGESVPLEEEFKRLGIKEHGQIFHPNEIAKTRSALVLL